MGLKQLLFGRMIERRLAAYQNELMEKHCEEVRHIYQTMRGWRHDFHNHIQALLALSGEEEKTREYLLNLNDDLIRVDSILKTGNVMVDAILNSKLSLIRSREIEVNAKAWVPDNLRIAEIDLCVVIGNLLDNAMEACLRQPAEEHRFIRVFFGRAEKSALSFRFQFDGGRGAEERREICLHERYGRARLRPSARGPNCGKIWRLRQPPKRGGRIRHRDSAAAVTIRAKKNAVRVKIHTSR